MPDRPTGKDRAEAVKKFKLYYIDSLYTSRRVNFIIAILKKKCVYIVTVSKAGDWWNTRIGKN
jgi:hypothetical protein